MVRDPYVRDRLVLTGFFTHITSMSARRLTTFGSLIVKLKVGRPNTFHTAKQKNW